MEEAATGAIAGIEAELKAFYEGDRFGEHMSLVNDVIAVLKGAGLNDSLKELMGNIGCIFEAHLPDVHAVIKRLSRQDADRPAERIEIRMKPILQKDIASSGMVNSLFKNVSWELPTRLNLFSEFCLQNKKAINKLLQGRQKGFLGLQFSDIAKFMPNLLDFESKREHFYKEIEKLR